MNIITKIKMLFSPLDTQELSKQLEESRHTVRELQEMINDLNENLDDCEVRQAESRAKIKDLQEVNMSHANEIRNWKSKCSQQQVTINNLTKANEAVIAKNARIETDLLLWKSRGEYLIKYVTSNDGVREYLVDTITQI